jgi:hypothetical protein
LAPALPLIHSLNAAVLLVPSRMAVKPIRLPK